MALALLPSPDPVGVVEATLAMPEPDLSIVTFAESDARIAADRAAITDRAGGGDVPIIDDTLRTVPDDE